MLHFLVLEATEQIRQEVIEKFSKVVALFFHGNGGSIDEVVEREASWVMYDPPSQSLVVLYEFLFVLLIYIRTSFTNFTRGSRSTK